MENLISLDPLERDTLLPGDRMETALDLAAPARAIDPSKLDGDGAWRDLLREADPQIMVAAWKTPPLPQPLREVAPNLKYVCYLAGSVRKLVTREMLEEGLQVTNWGNSISRTVAECSLLLILSGMRRVRYWTEQMHFKGGWKTPQTTTQSLFERRVGLHGFGAIARELTKLLKPFGCPISSYSLGVPDELLADEGVSRCGSLEKLFADHDVIVELEALTERNRGVVTEQLLQSMPKGACFVNLGRGAVVDEEALARVARGRPDLQIGLDVYGEEPLPTDSPFRGMENVMLLPHLGGPTTDRRRDAGDHALDNLRRFRKGEPLRSAISPEVYDRIT